MNINKYYGRAALFAMLLLGGVSSAGAQTSTCQLVINGNFENQLATPSKVNNMGGGGEGGAGATNVPDQLSDWYSPTGGSPDYYGTNAASNSDVQPNNAYSPVAGFYVYSGIHAIGLLARQAYTIYADQPYDRVSECATSRLPNGALTPGKYYAQYQVSLSGSRRACISGIKRGFGLIFTSASPTGPYKVYRDTLIIPSDAATMLSGPIGEEAVNRSIASWRRVSGQFSVNANQSLKYVTVGLFNFGRGNMTQLPSTDGNFPEPKVYFFVDDIQLFKIPSAGSNITACDNRQIVIGEGCDIPGATYAWTTGGSSSPFATTIQTPVNPTTTTSYTLTVTLPDGSTSVSTILVTPNIAPPVPTVYVGEPEEGINQVTCYVTNYNSNYTYLVQKVYRAVPVPSYTDSGQFLIKVTGGTCNGTFTVKATDACGRSTTSGVYQANFYCNNDNVRASTMSATAYPNPATESLAVPVRAKQPVLLNSQGQPVLKPDASGQLDVRNLPAGLYNLQMYQDGKLINQRIQVKH